MKESLSFNSNLYLSTSRCCQSWQGRTESPTHTHTLSTHINQNTFPCPQFRTSPWKSGEEVLHFDFLQLRQSPPKKEEEQEASLIITLKSWINQRIWWPNLDRMKKFRPGQDIDKLILSFNHLSRSSCSHLFITPRFYLSTSDEIEKEKMFHPAGGHLAQNFCEFLGPTKRRW